MTGQAFVCSFRGNTPEVDGEAFVAPNASIIGDVVIEKSASVWFGAVLRGDIMPIRIGARSNVQDGVIIHGDEGRGVSIGKDVTIGHGAVVHGATVEDGALIGMGAVVLDGAVIGKGALVAAGAVIGPGKNVPAGTLWAGCPARQIKELSAAAVANLSVNSEYYVNYSAAYRAELGA